MRLALILLLLMAPLLAAEWDSSYRGEKVWWLVPLFLTLAYLETCINWYMSMKEQKRL